MKSPVSASEIKHHIASLINVHDERIIDKIYSSSMTTFEDARLRVQCLERDCFNYQQSLFGFDNDPYTCELEWYLFFGIKQ